MEKIKPERITDARRGEDNLQNLLGKWAVIDIETTGLDPEYDQIIDVGFLQFEGLELKRKYSSLVKFEGQLPLFIKKLTGISPEMLKKAPTWTKVRSELQDLAGHQLLAHNSKFEESFLGETFMELAQELGEEQEEDFVDSMPFLALMNPGESSLKLENFILKENIAEGEVHRGYEDSLDLLKVILVQCYKLHQDPAFKIQLESVGQKYLEDFFPMKFLSLTQGEILTLAEEIEFDLLEHLETHKQTLGEQSLEELTPRKVPFTGAGIQDLLRDEESMTEVLDHYYHRPSQEALSLRVGQSFKNNIHSIIEAPTGTGKTLGYLIPSALFNRETREQVLVATGTKALQYQAKEKDIPLLRKTLGLSEDAFKVSLLKGSSNHFCELSYRQKETEDLFFEQKELEEKIVLAYFEMLFFTNSRVSYDQQITREEFPYALKRGFTEYGHLENELKVDFRTCTGQKCAYSRHCSYLKGLRKAKEADVILGNHSLMFTWPKGIDRPKYIVVDEAHKVEGEATSSFTTRIDKPLLEGLYKSLQNSTGVGPLYYILSNHAGEENPEQIIQNVRNEVAETARVLGTHLMPLEEKMEFYFKKAPRYTSLFWNELPMVDFDSLSEGHGAGIFNLLQDIKFVLHSLYETLLPFTMRFEMKDFKEENDTLAWSRFEAFASQIIDLYEGLTLIMEGRQGYYLSMKYHEDFGYAFEAAPIDVGKKLFENLLTESSSVVFTSATLGGAQAKKGQGNGLQWSLGYTYAPAEKRFKAPFYLDPQFNYQENAKVYICDDTPKFFETNFVDNVLAKVFPLITKLGGRTLLLFSARSRFEVARELLIKKFEGEIPLFIQGMGENLVENFKQSDQGILLGMEMFGEGIDIPGDKLQFLFIDKIPDLRQDLIIKERRDFYNRSFGDEFSNYYLAHRARSLSQKLGRLLRTEKDRGAALVVDGRIKGWKPRTKDDLFGQLSPYKIHSAKLDDALVGIEEFLLTNKREPLQNSDVVLS